jgi:thioredoxin reductase
MLVLMQSDAEIGQILSVLSFSAGLSRWRKRSRSGCRVSGGNNKTCAHARHVCHFGREHVALLNSPYRRGSCIAFRPHTEIIALEGGDHLESVRWRNSQMGQTAEHKIRHVFLMTGADPNTSWLDGYVALDPKGFIKTGSELSPENLSAARWPLLRPPYLLEACLPGVFAVGDVRGGSIKRVASVVG